MLGQSKEEKYFGDEFNLLFDEFNLVLIVFSFWQENIFEFELTSAIARMISTLWIETDTIDITCDCDVLQHMLTHPNDNNFLTILNFEPIDTIFRLIITGKFTHFKIWTNNEICITRTRKLMSPNIRSLHFSCFAGSIDDLILNLPNIYMFFVAYPHYDHLGIFRSNCTLHYKIFTMKNTTIG